MVYFNNANYNFTILYYNYIYNKDFIIYNKLNVYTINVGYSLRSLCVGQKIFLGLAEGVDATHGRGVYTHSCFRKQGPSLDV